MSTDAPTLIIATLNIRYGRHARFNEVFGKLLPLVQERGWKLRAGYQSIVGQLTKVVHVWEMQDANAAPAMMRSLAGDDRFPEIAAGLAEVVVDETLEFVVTAPDAPREP